MSVNALNSPLSGLMANQYRQDVTANNVANVNTPGFQPQATPAAPAREAAGSAAYINDIGRGASARPAAAYGPQRPAPVQASAAPTAMTQTAETTAAPQMSNVDMITETANRMNAQNAYGANIPAAQAANAMTQTLMDMVG